MGRYSDIVMDHYRSPRNTGTLDAPSGVGRAGNPSCGDVMELSIRIEDGVITASAFRTYGCGAAIAASSIFTEMIRGRNVDEAVRITSGEIAAALGGLPPGKERCSVLAPEALLSALADWRRRREGGA